jgi:serine/threonine protein kinase
MSLAPGTKLGPYDILAPLGAGGMGEVYRAHDRRLGRDVAVKISGQAFSDRFEREARAVATLNHPNICTLHDVGPDYLVMELVEGPTLADRIQEGPVPPDEAMALAAQIASALEAAHDHGIVHRDLKPGNIKIRDDGTLKVLDFGLAKRAAPAEALASGSLSDSPTVLDTPTEAGLILGTAAYMAPEQAKGKAIDRRADIWAFGVVLWEMLTGRRLFPGESASEILAAVLRNEPDLDAVPARVRPLLRHCLEKDPKRRLRDIGDWRLLMDSKAESGQSPPSRRSWLPWALAAGLGVALAVVASMQSGAPAIERQTMQFGVPPPAGTAFFFSQSGGSISPDGRYLALAVFGEGGGLSRLWLRPVDSLEGRFLPGTEGVNYPSWSPDSQSIVFGSFPDNQLKRVGIAGGSAQVLCQFPTLLGNPAWHPDGTIVFGGPDGLHAVSQNGGPPRRLTDTATRKETGHSFPQFLPDGRRLLYLVQSPDPAVAGAYVSPLDRPDERTRIMATSDKVLHVTPRPGAQGYLLFLRDQALLAQRFDDATLTLAGDPAVVAEGFSPASAARGGFWASPTGLLAFRRTFNDQNRRVTWIDRAGNRGPLTPEGLYQSFRLSPDGRAIAYDAASFIEDLWRFDFARGVRTRLTSEAGRDVVPVWSPDGTEIAFMSNRTGAFQLYRKDAHGGSGGRLLTAGPFQKYVTDWGGQHLIYHETAQGTREDLWALPLAPGSKPVAILNSPARERFGLTSHDGKWIAYTTDESGREEVEIRAFPGGRRWTVSTQGGTLPRWSRDGRTLFYLAPSRNVVMAVDVTSAAAGIETGAPRAVFKLPWTLPNLISPYDVQADGQRVLVLEPVALSDGTTPVTVVIDWHAALRD